MQCSGIKAKKNLRFCDFDCRSKIVDLVVEMIFRVFKFSENSTKFLRQKILKNQKKLIYFTNLKFESKIYIKIIFNLLSTKLQFHVYQIQLQINLLINTKFLNTFSLFIWSTHSKKLNLLLMHAWMEEISDCVCRK
jgi:hypothetical protein